MLGHCKMILEDDRGKIAINPDGTGVDKIAISDMVMVNIMMVT